eukprot:scaffold79644_cov13-Tisochrysis_lutea.AAC.1
MIVCERVKIFIFCDEWAVSSGSSSSSSSSSPLLLQASVHAQARACAQEEGSVRSQKKRREVRRARKGMQALMRTAVRVRKGMAAVRRMAVSVRGVVAAVMRRERRGVAALRVEGTRRFWSRISG